MIFNNRLDAVVTGLLVLLVAMIVVESAREWVRVLSGRKAPQNTETPFVPTRFGELQAEEAR